MEGQKIRDGKVIAIELVVAVEEPHAVPQNKEIKGNDKAQGGQI